MEGGLQNLLSAVRPINAYILYMLLCKGSEASYLHVFNYFYILSILSLISNNSVTEGQAVSNLKCTGETFEDLFRGSECQFFSWPIV